LRLPAFLREPFKHIEVQHPRQAESSLSPEAAPTLWLAVFPRLRISIGMTGKTPAQKPCAAQNIKEQPAHRA
jgi:hypothetical protein